MEFCATLPNCPYYIQSAITATENGGKAEYRVVLSPYPLMTPETRSIGLTIGLAGSYRVCQQKIHLMSPDVCRPQTVGTEVHRLYVPTNDSNQDATPVSTSAPPAMAPTEMRSDGEQNQRRLTPSMRDNTSIVSSIHPEEMNQSSNPDTPDQTMTDE